MWYCNYLIENYSWEFNSVNRVKFYSPVFKILKLVYSFNNTFSKIWNYLKNRKLYTLGSDEYIVSILSSHTLNILTLYFI